MALAVNVVGQPGGPSTSRPILGGPASPPSPRLPSSGTREVHLWSALTGHDSDYDRSHALLDETERARAARFKFDIDRVRFVFAHAFSRRVLGHYLGVDPAALRFGTAALGKPQLDPDRGISFNLSRDDDLTVVAVAAGFAVGVDVERLRHIDDALELSRGLFAEPEVKLLSSSPPHDRSRTFLSLWTRKESYVKATGGGLSIPLDGFVAIAEDGGPAGQAQSALGPLPYAFAQFDERPDYIGAVTVAGTQVAIHRMGSREVLPW